MRMQTSIGWVGTRIHTYYNGCIITVCKCIYRYNLRFILDTILILSITSIYELNCVFEVCGCMIL